MSTHGSDGKSSCNQSQAHTEKVSVSLQTSSTQEQRVGIPRSFQDTNGNEKCLTRASAEHLQPSKNLCIRQKLVLQSRGPWVSAPENQSKSRGQLQFISFYTARFPSDPSERNRTHVRTTKRLRRSNLPEQSHAVRTVPDVQHQQFCEKDFQPISLRASSPEEKNESKLQKPSDTHHWQNHVGHEILEGIPHGLTLCGTAQPTKNDFQGESVASVHLTELPVYKSESAEKKPEVNDPVGENAEGPCFHSNLIFSRGLDGSKASTDCQFSACSSTAIKQTLSSPSSPDSQHSTQLETETDIKRPSAEMFTSTLVSVLAPHWSGRFRRHKRGLSEPDIQLSGQNINPSSSSQNIHQRSFLLNDLQTRGEGFDGFSNKPREPGGTNRYSLKWEKENPTQNPTTPLQLKRDSFKTNSMSPNRQTVHQMQEFGKEPRPSLSLQLGDYRRVSQSVDKIESYSSLRSRPTTSTLLLSGRRSNARQPNAESLQMSKHLSTSVTSLNLSGKSMLGIYSQNLPSVSQNDPTRERVESTSFSPSAFEPTSGAEQSVSPSPRVMEASMRPLFLRTSQDINDITNENLFANDISNKTSQVTTRVRLLSYPSTRVNQPESLKSKQQDIDEIRGKQQRPVRNSGPMEQTIADNKNLHSDTNSNITHSKRSAIFLSNWSPKDNGNTRCLLNNGNPNSRISERITGSQISQTTSTNLMSSTCVQPEKTYDKISASQTSPHPIESNAISPTAGLTSMSLVQANQSSAQNSSSSDKLSPSSTSSVRTRTFTDSLSISPKKDFSVEDTSTAQKWQNYLNSRRNLKGLNQVSVDQANPQSASEFIPRRRSSSIYSYLRETSPPKTMQMSSTLTSSRTQTSSLKHDRFQMPTDDKSSGTCSQNLRFSFDCSPVEQDGFLTRVSCSSNAPQSLPPDTGQPVARLSKSPYSTLISSRQRLNSTSSSPGPYHHIRAVSFDSTAIGVNFPQVDKAVFSSVNQDQVIQITSGGSVDSDNNKVIKQKSLASSASVDTLSPSLRSSSQNTQDMRFPDHQTSILSSNTTHPKQGGNVIKQIPSEGRNGRFSSQCDKGKTCAADILSSKGLSLHGKETLQAHEVLQQNQSPRLENSLFFVGSKKDNVLRSASSADVKDSTFIKGEMSRFKTTNKVEQLFYISVKGSNPSNDVKSSSFYIPNDKVMQRTSGKLVCPGKNQIMVRIEETSVPLNNCSETSLEASISDHQPSNSITNNKHLRRLDTIKENIHPKGLHEMSVSQCETGNPNAADLIHSKEPPSTITISSAMQGETFLQTHEALQANQSSNSKRSFFSLKSRKDNTLTSASSADKGEATLKKGELTGFKTKKMDQMLNRLRLTFGVKPSEDDDTVKKKTKNQEPSDVKAFDKTRKDEQKSLDSPNLKLQKSQNSQMTSMKESGYSLWSMSGSKTETQEILPNMDNPKQTDDNHIQLNLNRSQYLGRPLSSNSPEPTKKEEKSLESSLKSQNFQNSQITFMRQPSKSSSPELVYVPKRQDISPNLVNPKLTDESRSQLLGVPQSPIWHEPESTRKSEEICYESFHLKSQKSPGNLRKSGNSPSPLSDITPERREIQLNADNHKRLDLNRNQFLGRPISPNWLMGQYEAPKKEEEQEPQHSASPKSPNSSVLNSNYKPDRSEISLNMENQKGMDTNKSQFLGRPLSPNWPKPDVMNHSATLPRGGKSSPNRSHSPCSFELLSGDVQNDNVFYSPTWRKNASFDELEDVSHWNKNMQMSRQNSMGNLNSSSSADLMYGIQRGRSFSVSSVVSGRPSGPGRISTGSKQGSISDLSSLDGFVTKSRHSSIGSPIGSPETGATAYSSHVVHNMSRSSAEWSPPDGYIKNQVNTEASSFRWDTDTDPTPPPSPPASRRISQIASSSSTSSRSSPDCMSPRGFLPSRSYKTTLSVFEESDSETTTDDEYYFNSDDEDEKETEL